MTNGNNEQIQTYTRFFKVLSDPTRLVIVLLLAKGALCVCQIEAALKVHQAKISRHLAYLRRHGIVKVKSQWKWKYYLLFEPRNKFEQGLLKCLEECLANDALFKPYFSQMKQCVSQPLESVAKMARKL
ncbi:MAG: metalloregulator ArsR/SmtB family transcription factor [Candidatus Omnitrophica bacterium]|nr:metalloregulator ArsR/SmtB family transcription factor [Candidatus Omnitrophota bacterium]